jgi:tetratricopeptide (TPR) repeat protein
MTTDKAATADTIVKEGLDHHRAGRFSQAEAAYRHALDVAPDHPSALHLLGVLAYQHGQIDSAIGLITKAIAFRPHVAEFHNNLGNTYQAGSRFGEAETAYRRAIALRNDYPEAWNNLGNIHLGREEFESAVNAHRQAIALDPSYADAHYNLGNTLKAWGKLPEAIDAYDQAVALKPGAWSIHNNLAVALQAVGDLDRAGHHCEQARVLAPDSPEPHVISAIVLLMQGDFAAGFDEYEWRWKAPDWPQPPRNFPQAPWDGAALDGKSIVVWAEQGVGDEIMFAGMIPEITTTADHCLVDCDPRLAPLFMRSFEAIETVGKSDPPAPSARSLTIDFQAATGSLAQWLRRTEQSFPNYGGYLKADPELTCELRERYENSGDDLIVGISWRSGNAMYGGDRSAPLDLWDPVLTSPGIQFVSLQYGDCATGIAAVHDRLGVTVINDESIDPLADLDGFAAQVAAMDLVISIDNSTVHMAGALGKTVWTLLPHVPDWRWMTGRDDSPWYPSMLLIRQQSEGDWRGLMERVGRKLADYP